MESPTRSSDRIAVTFSSDTLVTSLSSGIKSIAGYSRHEMLGRPIARILADRTLFEMPRILDTVKDKGSWEGEIDYRGSNRTTITAYSTIMPLSESGPGISGYLLLSHLAESENSVCGTGSSDTNAGPRVRIMVHDLNNHLAVIMGSTQLLALNSGWTGKIRTDIEKLYGELERMARVVERLHGYAISLCEKSPNSSVKEDSIQGTA